MFPVLPAERELPMLSGASGEKKKKKNASGASCEKNVFNESAGDLDASVGESNTYS